MRPVRALCAKSFACLVTLAASGGFAARPDVARPRELRLDGHDVGDPSASADREAHVPWPDWIELRLPLLPEVSTEPRDERPIDEASPLPFPALRERPTVELLQSVGFSLRPRPFRVALPIDGDVAQGQYLRDDDVVRSPIAIDRELFVKWSADSRIQLEAGYWITYLSSEGATPSYLRHGPCAGVALEF